MQNQWDEARWSASKRARVEAARARRRVIFNDDTYELSRDDAGTPEGFLSRRLKPLAGTHVSTIAWSVLGGWADAPVYDSKVQPIYGDAHGGPPTYWPKVTENIKSMVAGGVCPFQAVIDFSRDGGMEAFASIRMNDVHDSFIPGGLTTWKMRHPEWLVDTNGTLPDFELYTSSQDFSHEPVRRRKLEIIEEICERYDVDGFELDYIRHPVLFSRRMRGEPCTRDEIEIMTSLMRQVREMTDAAAARRGRPVLISARVPDSFALSLDNGLDLQAWLEQDLVDIVIAGGGYAPCSLPVEEFIEASRPHGVQVYPCINQGAASDVSGGSVLEGVRGLVSTWYRAGADGVYFWNVGTPFEYKTGDDLVETRDRVYACLDEVGEPAVLADKTKLFCVDNGSAYPDVTSRWPLPMVSKRGSPMTLRRGVIGRVPLRVGDEIEARRPTRATLKVEFDDAAWREVLLFGLNGEELSEGKFAAASDGQEGGTLSYAVSVPPLKSGRNFIEVAARHVEIPESLVTINAIRLRVEYS